MRLMIQCPKKPHAALKHQFMMSFLYFEVFGGNNLLHTDFQYLQL